MPRALSARPSAASRPWASRPHAVRWRGYDRRRAYQVKGVLIGGGLTAWHCAVEGVVIGGGPLITYHQVSFHKDLRFLLLLFLALHCPS
eukprot:244809-Chlamydomonas_euryale.AAC.1